MSMRPAGAETRELRDKYEQGKRHERARLQQLLERCLARLTGADRGEPCSVVIRHGPGHQSKTECSVCGPHDVHETIFGSDNREARWRGGDISSGTFDEARYDDSEDETRERLRMADTLIADLCAELGENP